MSPRLAGVLPARRVRPADPGRGDEFVAAAPPGPGLWIRLFGPPRVTWKGCPLEIPRLQARALLFRLAVAPHGVSRARLRFLFWPDISETTASRRFSRLLAHLRRALPAPEIVTADHDSVKLDLGQVWSDALAFVDLVSLQDPANQVDRLRSAVTLYQGAFLAGFSLQGCSEFEAWSLQERCTLERHYLEALQVLIEERATAGAFPEAIDLAQRYLQVDDLAETIHRRLMELYALAGDRSAALQQYEHCAVVLERELGVDPVPETRAAYEALLHRESAAKRSLP